MRVPSHSACPQEPFVPGEHAPCPMQDQEPHLPPEHVRRCLPQLPHALPVSVAPLVHSAASLHALVLQFPHWQEDEHVRVLLPVYPLSHDVVPVAPGEHAPCPEQELQPPHAVPLLLHVRFCVPQLPHDWLCDALGVHTLALHPLRFHELQPLQLPQLHVRVRV